MHPIDFHAHFFPERIAAKVVERLADHYGIPVNYRGIKGEYLALARRAGLQAAVFCTAATRPEQVKSANEWALANRGKGLVPFGTLHPDMDDIDGELKMLRAAGVRGIKLHPDFQSFHLDEDRALALYERLIPDFVLLLHVGDEEIPGRINYATPEQLSRVLDLLPELKVIAAHMGGYQMWDRAMNCLVGRGVYFDTSSCLEFLPDEQFLTMVREHGVEKVLMGSDYPFRDPGWEVARLAGLGLSREELEAIIGNNARRLLAQLGL